MSDIVWVTHLEHRRLSTTRGHQPVSSNVHSYKPACNRSRALRSDDCCEKQLPSVSCAAQSSTRARGRTSDLGQVNRVRREPDGRERVLKFL